MQLSPTLIAALGVALLVLLLAWWLRARRRPRLGVPASVERRWTRHVRERMEQRGISEAMVEAALTRPARCTHDPVERSWKFEHERADLLVKVWVTDDPWPPVDQVVIKSAAVVRRGLVRLPRGSAGRVIGRQGATIREIRALSGARIEVDVSRGQVVITAAESGQVQHARRLVRAALARR